MVTEIHRETQLVDQTGQSVYKDLGMFVLVITSHGAEGTVVGSDHKHIKLTDIYQLLSAQNFPAMKGKPKLLVIQACAGVNREMMTDSINDTAVDQQYNRQEVTSQTADYGHVDSEPSDISVANLFVMQASFDTFVSIRSTDLGSQFIRAVVVTFYKYAHKQHLQTLGNMIQKAVSKSSVQRTDELRQIVSPQDREKAYVAQMPKITSTMCNRPLYLEPGIDMRHLGEHPASVTTDVRDPNPPQTTISWLADDVVTTRGGGGATTSQNIRKWRIDRT